MFDRFNVTTSICGQQFLGSDALKCHGCRGLSLEDCLRTSGTCRPEQNRCMSFMLEGGNNNKIYYKRCGRKNECYSYNIERICEAKRKIHGSSSCRPACCETDKCNHSNQLSSSWLIAIPTIVFFLKIIFS